MSQDNKEGHLPSSDHDARLSGIKANADVAAQYERIKERRRVTQAVTRVVRWIVNVLLVLVFFFPFLWMVTRVIPNSTPLPQNLYCEKA